MASTAAFHARARGSVPGLGGLKETKMFLPHPRVKVSIVGSLRDREVACSASDRQGSNFESCVWRTMSSQSSHHLQEVLLAQFSLYVHKGGLKPDSFHLQGSNPGRAGYLSLWLYIYSTPNCSEAGSVQCCLWYCELQRTFELIRNESRALLSRLRLPFVAILLWLCRRRRKPIFTHSPHRTN